MSTAFQIHPIMTKPIRAASFAGVTLIAYLDSSWPQGHTCDEPMPS
jgi:hypothetical protein